MRDNVPRSKGGARAAQLNRQASMLTDAQVIEEWRQRRSSTWRAIRVALTISVICGGAFWYLAKTPASAMNGTQLLATFAIFCALGTAMLVVIFRTNRLYRCPRCDSVPMGEWAAFGSGPFGYESGVALNPKRCASCGAVLRVAD